MRGGAKKGEMEKSIRQPQTKTLKKGGEKGKKKGERGKVGSPETPS